MREEERRTKWLTTQLSLHRPGCGKKQTDLRGENIILDLISVGAPLLVVLNNLCTAIDLQIGGVVSVVLLPDDAERNLQAIAEGAQQFGLHVFWSASIPLRDENILGSFEMYCCVPRMPSPFELRLIQRATELAGLAIQSHHGEGELGENGSEWKSALLRRSHEAAQLN
jgi:GAF domain-containing protein